MSSFSELMNFRYGITVTQEQERLLLDDLHAVMEVNQTINLTRIVSEEGAMVLHLEDSLTGLSYLNDAPAGLYGDLGTGGGFPGIPLCIMTGRRTVLIDSVKKKVKALEDVSRKIGLDDFIEGYAGRIEDLALERKGEFSALTARALSSLPSLMELAAPLLRKGGRLICYKSQPSDEEMNMARDIEGLLGLSMVACDEFELSDGSKRCMVLYEKVEKPHIRLPRRVGMAQKHPLTRNSR